MAEAAQAITLSPLDIYELLRELHELCSTREQSPETDSPELDARIERLVAVLEECGATPKDVVLGQYSMVPLYQATGKMANDLDVAATRALKDVMPPRLNSMNAPIKLDPIMSANFKKSIAVLQALDDQFEKSVEDGHCVQYIFSLATLLHSPTAAHHFVQRMNSVSMGGMVDFHKVDDMLEHPDGEPAGVFVVVNAVINA